MKSNASELAVINIAVLITCFNRKLSTLKCVRALIVNSLPSTVRLTVVVVDDGSTDGTAQLLEQEFPEVHIHRSPGDLYWCRGMHQAQVIANQFNPDFYLWLNDDTILQSDTITRLLSTEEQIRAKSGKPVVVVGNTIDEQSGTLTYGGCARLSGLKKMRFTRIQPTDIPQRCDTMNGNVVLVSKEVAEIVGYPDPVFEHAMGDTDYALRAVNLGVDVWTAPGVHGTCSDNPSAGTYMDTSLPLRKRWKLMMGRKGLPWRSWLVLTKRHAGPAWPLYFAWPYISLIAGLYKKRDTAKA